MRGHELVSSQGKTAVATSKGYTVGMQCDFKMGFVSRFNAQIDSLKVTSQSVSCDTC